MATLRSVTATTTSRSTGVLSSSNEPSIMTSLKLGATARERRAEWALRKRRVSARLRFVCRRLLAFWALAVSLRADAQRLAFSCKRNNACERSER